MLKPIKLANKNFLSSLDTSCEEFLHILEIAKNFKSKDLNIKLKEKVLGLIFDKSSTRTRVSFQVAMSRLGGTTVDLNPTTSQIGRGEPIRDTARVLSRYCDVLARRTFKQSDLEEYAIFFFKQKTAYEMLRSLVGSEMCIRDSIKIFNVIFY